MPVERYEGIHLGETPEEITEEVERGVLLTTMDRAVGWARKQSMWPATFGLACCAIEMMATFASRFDVERLGMVPWASPRHADLMIVSGTVTIKMAPMLKRIYEQMADPKWCISMGSCANSGGPFRHGYHVVKGVDRVVPVDVYVPGCPPRPEALLQGILKLQEKIDGESLRDRYDSEYRATDAASVQRGLVLPPGAAR